MKHLMRWDNLLILSEVFVFWKFVYKTFKTEISWNCIHKKYYDHCLIIIVTKFQKTCLIWKVMCHWQIWTENGKIRAALEESQLTTTWESGSEWGTRISCPVEGFSVLSRVLSTFFHINYCCSNHVQKTNYVR